ncbi:uncharacterized protein LOC126554283, partial [Aphis gossypii]|uniref:uncharacterized protein LOC126554283 n=1 Tax=Aphis gossypii TaxID=80765 RepID=UPI002158CBF8
MKYTRKTNKPSWVPPTGRVGPQEPAVGSSARPDGRYHHALGHAQTITETCYAVITDKDEPLRLRGGGDEPEPEDVEMEPSNTKSGGSGVMVKDNKAKANTATKKSPPSSGGPLAKKTAEVEVGSRLNAIFGWLEHTISLERTKKLSAQSSDGMIEKIAELRNLMHTILGENNRLKGRLMEKEDSAKNSLTTFVYKISEKADEIGQLKSEIQELKKSMVKQAVPPHVATNTTTYAQVTGDKPQTIKVSVPKTKTKTHDKCRKTKANTRFVVDVPDDRTVTDVKMDLWKTVRDRLPNPRAKTIVAGNTLVIIPDDTNTLEVLQNVPNMRS